MDAELLRGFRAGDPAAFTRLYREYAKEVQCALARRATVTKADLADVVQEVFLRVFSARVRAQYDGTRSFRPFLHVIARHVLWDWRRRQKREASTILIAGEHDARTGARNFDTPDALRFADAVDVYVSTLPEELRSVYTERFLHSRTQQDAASSLGISRQTLRTRERRLVEGLKAALRRSGLLSARARKTQCR